MNATLDIQDIIDNIDRNAPLCTKFDRAALEGDGVIARIWSFSATNDYIAGEYDDLIDAANKCGYGVTKVAGRGTAYGLLVLTPKSRRAFNMLRLGRVRKIQRLSGATPRQANVIERACRRQWGHELMGRIANAVVTLDNEGVDANVLRYAARVLAERGHARYGVEECADILGIDLGDLSVPRSYELLDAVIEAVAELRGIEI